MIGTIGEMLCFQTKGASEWIGCSVFTDVFALKEISAVKLQPGLGGPNLHPSAAGGVQHFSSELHSGFIYSTLQYKIVVIASSE
jgi:hypothetical protein